MADVTQPAQTAKFPQAELAEIIHTAKALAQCGRHAAVSIEAEPIPLASLSLVFADIEARLGAVLDRLDTATA